jgi:DNA (cytosine-5)-methyltransferase 1
MKFGSVCSGIEAASVAWNPLGWEAAFFAEIEKFPSAVLAHHYPNVPNLGDMTKFKEWPDYELDVLVGGTPCQSFSIAGLRKGLDDPRGNLMLTYLAIAARYRPRFLVWENVPGVLSSNGGKDFGTFLGGLGELGYGFAYRILDAQYAGIPQRRRRVFVVGCLGSWQRAAALLFECHSLSGDTPPRREKGQEITGTIGARTTAGGGFGGDFETAGGLQAVSSTGDISHYLNAGGMERQDYETETLIAHSLRAEGFDASEDGTGRGTPLVPVVASTLKSNSGGGGFGSDPSETFIPVGAVAYRTSGDGAVYEEGDKTAALTTGTDPSANVIKQHMQVRRLTPKECARLQGFPDSYLDITFNGKPAADGNKYKALGNSMAVPCMTWLGQRIDAVSKITSIQKKEVA